MRRRFPVPRLLLAALTPKMLGMEASNLRQDVVQLERVGTSLEADHYLSRAGAMRVVSPWNRASVSEALGTQGL